MSEVTGMNDGKKLRTLKNPKKYRTIFLSDIHLGFKGCQADFLLDFLSRTESDFLYLVGDIFDGWEMKKKSYWPASHQKVVNAILKKAATGTRVIYTPGNHDESARHYCGHTFDNIEIRDTAMHEAADGRKLLVLHGDQFDTVVQCNRFLSKAGSTMYGRLLTLNRVINAVRGLLGLPYWSLAAHLKHKVKNVVSYIGRFEEAVVNSARSQGVQGVVCGHIHHAEITMFGDTLYCNTGDWVESCTAMVENRNGKLEILKWTELAELIKSGQRPKRAPALNAA
ncbi:MAG: UDP-2,3-diacylglucosamine diphosphatase [Gammaproteobacteria bacterium]|nr:UDP-2,3-diacylglucosamine diphosphatase [Gammaproteobacteria bacterium]